MKKQEPVNCSDSELCTYLQELEAGYLPTFYSDTNQFAPSKSMSIASKSYQRGRKTVSFHGFQSLTMCKHSTEYHGADSLTSFPVDFHAKTSASPGKEQESTESVAGYGQRWCASLAKYDLDTHSWKTAQRSLIEDSDECSVIWPRSGMTVDGECWELPMLVRRTKETGYGLWLYPTPTCNPEAPNHGSNSNGPHNLLDAAKQKWKPGMLWPTPRARDHHPNGGTQGSTIDLPNVVKRRTYPTATATAYKGWSQNHNRADTDDRLDYTVERQGYTNGQKTPPMRLNPEWVEVLMGWPNGMTSLNPISSVKMCFWLMGFCDDEETGRTQVLRVLREGNAAKEVREAIGRSVCISEAAFLLHELCEYANRPYEARIFMACAEALEEEMRSVRLYEGVTGAPHRPGQDAQRTGKHTDSMQALSRLLAHHGQKAWKNGSWEDGIPRVVDGVANRVDRLKAIGNGQVPLCAATAWRMLTSL